VRSVPQKAFRYAKIRRGAEVSVRYEVREPLFGNLDALLTFSHKIQIEP
jgi:hypothetical protein